ncbi:MAG: hypothetical protein IJ760_06590 [Bacteroidales bacterium]|nr:hypothetical protein [Bacteroidales bacterium]
MKRIVTVAAAMLIALGGAVAQNSFKGVVKYNVESTGSVAVDLPDAARVAEIKVSGDDMYTKSPIFCSGMTEAVLVQGMTMTNCMNLSNLLGYLRSEGNEFTYEGSGKLLVKNTSKESDFDSLAIKDEEPGHFYYEYVDGETMQIAGVTARKLIRHQFDDEGKDHQMVMWYSSEIGPGLNLLFGGIKGMPLQCTVEVGEDRAITYTAVEIVKGKVKESDFLLPAGYETLGDEDLETLFGEINDAIELMQD